MTIKRKNIIRLRIACIIIVLIGVIILIVMYYKNKKNQEHFSLLKLFDNTPITGYCLWTWNGNGGTEPKNMCDIGILFGGETPRVAIDNNINSLYKLTQSKEKFLNLGGGIQTGIWTLTDFDYINNQLNNIKNKGWTGLCFDVEVCTPGVSFINQFKDCFAKCKAVGLKVLVTMSHIIPYECKTGSGQGMDLVNSWITDKNIDYLAPQLYSVGDVLEPTDLSVLKNSIAKIIPIIPYDTDWSKIQNLGLTPAGYITWLRSGLPQTINYCGIDWTDAQTKCSTARQCPKGQNSECPSGQKCFGGITCSGGGKKTVNLCGTNWDTVNCNTSVKCPNGTDGECPSGQKCFGNNKC